MATRQLTTRRIVNLSSDPVSGTEGELYYNTVSDKVRFYSNGEWIDLAPVASPTFTGTPAAPTAAVGTNTTQVATTAFVQTQIEKNVNFVPQLLMGGM